MERINESGVFCDLATHWELIESTTCLGMRATSRMGHSADCSSNVAEPLRKGEDSRPSATQWSTILTHIVN